MKAIVSWRREHDHHHPHNDVRIVRGTDPVAPDSLRGREPVGGQSTQSFFVMR
jgi:hypothetical protein